MPRGPKGERRPAIVIGDTVKVMRIAADEKPKDYGRAPESEGKDRPPWRLEGRVRSREWQVF
jgi:hypothetical protein